MRADRSPCGPSCRSARGSLAAKWRHRASCSCKHREDEALATGGGATEAFEAVVLAAGAGSRFGGGKLLAAWDAGVLLEGALAAAFAAPVRTVTVGIGADAPAVAAAARDFDPRTLVVHAADYAEGMGASLRTGIASLPADAAGAFVFLGDM